MDTVRTAAFAPKTLLNDPQFFGANLNMARHNIFRVINHLTETFSYLHFTPLKDDADIANGKHILANVFDEGQKKRYEDERPKIYNYLLKRHHLPFIKIFNNELLEEDGTNEIAIDYSRLHQFIIFSFKELHSFRNAYTHYLAIDNNGNKLDRKLTIDNAIKSDIELLFKYAPSFSFIRNEKTQRPEDYEHLLHNYNLFKTESSDEFTEQGLFFFINLFLERSSAIIFLKKFKGFKNETTPPFRATIQAFTTYSLKIPDEKLGNENPKQSLLLDMLTDLNKCPRELFNHLNERDKKEFEPKLDAEAKQNIVLNSTNYEEITDEALEIAIRELTTLKRYEDRFPYFALRFLDETEAFKNIRFQITLGKLITKQYEKTIIGNIQPRTITKTIKVFGRLGDFLSNDKEAELRKQKEILAILTTGIEKDETIQFDQFAPHYNINTNNIGFYIFNEDDGEQIKYPDIFLEKGSDTNANQNPTGFLSIHDLPKLLLLQSLSPGKAERLITEYTQSRNHTLLNKAVLDAIRNKTNYEPESFSKKAVNDSKKLGLKRHVDTFINPNLHLDKPDFEAFLNRLTNRELIKFCSRESMAIGMIKKAIIEVYSRKRYLILMKDRKEELERCLNENIKYSQLPAKVRAYLMNIAEPTVTKKLSIKLQQENKEVKDLLKVVEESKKKISESVMLEEKYKKEIKLGELATFLTRDIINMTISLDIKNKFTQPYANKLQNKTAYFSLNKDEIISICKSLDLFDKRKGHAFLTESLIKDSTGVIDFYLKYLNEKKEWLNRLNLISDRGVLKPIPPNLPFSFTAFIQKAKAETSEDYFTNWLARKSGMPVNLPKSLFDETSNIDLKKLLEAKATPYTQTDKFSVLLQAYLNADTQPFYNYTRRYNINKTEVEIDVRNLSSRELKDRYGENVESNEKLIRFYQTKDRIVKLLCDAMLKTDISLSINGEIMLNEIHPNSARNPLDRPAVFKRAIPDNNNHVLFHIVAKDTQEQKRQINAWEAVPAKKRNEWLALTAEDKKYLLKTLPENEQAIYQGQQNYQWTIKDFGRFKRFVKDKRLPGLSHYFEDKNIPFDLLEYQLKEYDRVRVHIFDLFFELEKTIAEKDFEGIKQLELEARENSPKQFNEVQFKIFLQWLEGLNSDFAKGVIKSGRNKFSHTQFPEFAEIGKITLKQVAEFELNKSTKDYKNSSGISIARKILALYEIEMNSIFNKIKNP